jgi:hypothetical protein
MDFSCPRCATEVVADFYGPCDECRTQLRAAMARAGSDVEAAAYEPKMNVVPNQVAIKD